MHTLRSVDATTFLDLYIYRMHPAKDFFERIMYAPSFANIYIILIGRTLLSLIPTKAKERGII
jgi:hypothetical protein